MLHKLNQYKLYYSKTLVSKSDRVNNLQLFGLMKASAFLFCTIFLLGSTIKIQAATYYMDATGGNDSNNGTTTSTPWQHVSKINSSTFSAGDQILFKKD